MTGDGERTQERTLRIEGGRIDTIEALYDELNRVLMQGEDWRLGQSLDALNDLLYGDYGSLSAGPARIIWADHEHTREALGPEATRVYYRAKLTRPEVFDPVRAQHALAELDAGTGKTYFEIVQEIFAAHPEVDVRWE